MPNKFSKLRHQQITPLIDGKYIVDPPTQGASGSLKLLQGLINYKDVASINTPLLGRGNLFIKRVIDIVLSLAAIALLLSWMIPLMALLIRIDSKGPVFFFQKRNKRNGRVFTCIKFRSMVVNAEAHVMPATEGDKRITRLGRFLRTHYLDELPQFFNVLWGDMSVVGPRPHMLSENLRYEEQYDFYNYRHQVKPGITGLAQVLGYVGPTTDAETMKERIRFDLLYIRHWSPTLDAKILLRSIREILRF